MARAQGARSQLAAAFETSYGTAPGSGYTRLPFASSTLSAEQPLLASELLGYGRDPLAPVRDAISVDGDIVVPIDAEGFGFWLKAAFGAPELPVAVKATGAIAMTALPEDGDSISLDGVTWRFVAGTPAGNETQIGGSVAATLTALASDLNLSAEPRIAAATYAATSGPDELQIEFDTPGTAGNRFTLAGSTADLAPSGPTLAGGYVEHEFRSGAWTLPSLALELAMPEVPRFAIYTGCMLDRLSWSMERSGLLTATASLVAQGEAVHASSQAGSPTDLPLTRFGHFNGQITRDGVPLGNVVSAQITYANNLDRIETIRADGRIDGADPSIAALTGQVVVRFADTVLLRQALDGTPCALEFAYSRPWGESLALTAHAVYLPRPRLEISGPGGVQASFDWQAARDPDLGRMATVTLRNNRGSY